MRSKSYSLGSFLRVVSRVALTRQLCALNWQTDSASFIMIILHFSRLTKRRSQSLEKRRYVALEQWVDALEGVHGAVLSKISAGRGGAEGMAYGMGGAFIEERIWA